MPQRILATTTFVNLIANEVYHVGLASDSLTESSFIAGQYLNICMPDGSTRPFSIATAPTDGALELIVRAAAAMPVTVEILDHLKHSAQIELEVGCGSCIIPSNQSDLILLAGGTGISPIRSILQKLSIQQSTQTIAVYWGVNSPDDLFLVEEFEKLCATLKNANLNLVCANPTDNWQGLSGFVHQAMLANTSVTNPDTHIVMSGSKEMVLAVFHALKAAGYDDHHIHADMLDIMRQFGELPACK
jgi:NAD(P)H-flavin reductase